MNKLLTAIAIVLMGLGYQAIAGEVTTEGTLLLSMEEGKEVTPTEGESKTTEEVTEEKEATEGETTEGKEATEGETTEGKEATEEKEATEGEETTKGVEDTDESSDDGDEEVEG